MKTYVSIGLLVVGLLLAMNGCSSYNGIKLKNEDIQASAGNLQVQYQRRMDLIPKLVKVVSSYANFEKSTLAGVTAARSQAATIKIDANNMTPQSLAAFDAAQSNVSSSLSRLMVVMEKYPDLKANTQFVALQAEIAGTENRIAIARGDFNDIVKLYNRYIDVIPKSMWASAFGFHVKPYFQANANAQDAPDINMDIH
jgi:LemA protein